MPSPSAQSYHIPARARRTAGLSGFFVLSQSRDGPDRYGALSRCPQNRTCRALIEDGGAALLDQGLNAPPDFSRSFIKTSRYLSITVSSLWPSSVPRARMAAMVASA